jgi:hypothetical protein
MIECGRNQGPKDWHCLGRKWVKNGHAQRFAGAAVQPPTPDDEFTIVFPDGAAATTSGLPAERRRRL